MRIGIGKRRQTNLLQVVQRPLFSLFALEGFRGQQRKHHVLFDGFPRRQLIEFLEHDNAVRPRRIDALTLKADLAFDWLDESRSGLEQCRLAATGRPEQDKTVRRIDLEADLVGGPHDPLGRAVFQADVIDRQQRLGCGDRFADRVVLQGGVHVGQLPCSGLASWKK
ncbi:hypothetical protein D3C76_1177310 [compost metagenome]